MEKIFGTEQNIGIKITTDTLLFFDMDGTLVDTNLANFLSYKKAIISVTKDDNGLIYNPERRFNRNILKKVVPNLSETKYKKIIQEKEKYYQDFLYETRLNTEISAILLKYSKTNKTVLVTNCREERALTTLNYYRLTDNFTNIFYKRLNDNDSKVNKYANAISKLGVHPNLVVVFENDEIEIVNAKLAGIEIINPGII